MCQNIIKIKIKIRRKKKERKAKQYRLMLTNKSCQVYYRSCQLGDYVVTKNKAQRNVLSDVK